MKKIFFFLLVIVASTGVSSCHKSRTCTCNYTGTTNGVSTTSTNVNTWSHISKHEAETNCISRKYQNSYTVGSTTLVTDVVMDCKLK